MIIHPIFIQPLFEPLDLRVRLLLLLSSPGPFSMSLRTIPTWGPVAFLHPLLPFFFPLPPPLVVPPPPAAPLATPSCEGLLLQDNAVSAEIRALLSSYYNDR